MNDTLMKNNRRQWEVTISQLQNIPLNKLHIEDIFSMDIPGIAEARLRFQANDNGKGIGICHTNIFQDDDLSRIQRVNPALLELIFRNKMTITDFDATMHQIYPECI